MKRVRRARNVRLAVVAGLFASTATVTAAAAGPDPLWIDQQGGSSYDQFLAVTIDPANNIVAAGQIDNGDPWIVKYNSAGAYQWQARLGKSGFDAANGVATDGNGNIFVSVYYCCSSRDGWVVKYAPSGGKPLWTKKIGTSSTDLSTGVAADAAGNIYVSGYTAGVLGGVRYGSDLDEDAWVAKLNAAGAILWIRQIGTDQDDQANAVAVDKQGNVIIAGATHGPLDGADPKATDYDPWLAKYDGNGNLLWKEQIVGKTQASADAIALDGSGNILIAGTSNGRIVPGPYGGFDAWVAKYTPSGGRSWIREYTLPPSDYGRGVAADAAGNVYLAGRSDISTRAKTFLVKYNKVGALQWESVIDALGEDDGGNAVAVDKAGNAYLAGFTYGALDGSNKGRSDAILAKFPPN
ncbi:MAG: SBBP repeat-containing protein [Rhodospirillales bacterium]